jgi:hypothetical protein
MLTFIVALEAHIPAFGVNVYVKLPTVEVLIMDGVHVPFIVGEFKEVVGKTGLVEN